MADERLKRMLRSKLSQGICPLCDNTFADLLKHHRDQQDTRNVIKGIGLWRRYVSSVLTSRQRISGYFWDNLSRQPLWQTIWEGIEETPPRIDSIERLLREVGIRTPPKKAAWIAKAWKEVDWSRLAKDINSQVKAGHTRDSNLCAVDVLKVLRGIGVGPKIRRLMLIWEPYRDANHGRWGFCPYLIPIDARWIRALNESGFSVSLADLNSEEKYREVENEVVDASASVGLLPYEADRLIFGSL